MHGHIDNDCSYASIFRKMKKINRKSLSQCFKILLMKVHTLYHQLWLEIGIYIVQTIIDTTNKMMKIIFGAYSNSPYI